VAITDSSYPYPIALAIPPFTPSASAERMTATPYAMHRLVGLIAFC
jgi:hypothetical protein